MRRFGFRARQIADNLGPGLITGAADDDPSGIATYSQAGAQFGAGLLWTLGFTTPLMIAIQLVSARIGWLTGKGLAASFRSLMPTWAAATIVGLLLVANTLNIGADIAAMGDALQPLVGGPEHGHALLFGLLGTVLPVWLGFNAMVRLLKWLTLALLSYVGVVLMLSVDWAAVLRDTVVPKLTGNRDYWTMVVAVLGTTISPYLFFWQAAQEAEQRQHMDRAGGVDCQTAASPAFVREHLYRIKLDTTIGMVFSNIIAFCVMLAAALTLYSHGITEIHTTAEAAQALRPLAGHLTFTLFACGIVGTGMLAVPVLAASSAYAVADLFEWRSGLDHHLLEARGFFSVIIFGTVIGTTLDFSPLDPMRGLVWSAVVNGTIAVPIMVVLMCIGASRAVLGDYTLSLRHRILGWFATAVMAVALLAMLLT